MTSQERLAADFRALHLAPPILVLANVWDVASAVAVADAPGCRALATSSAGVAAVLGYPDGERIPAGEMLDLVARIVRAVSVPVTADLEAGYGDPAATARAAWAAGAVGLNLEDANGPADEHVERVRAARAAVPALVINARVDEFLLGGRDLDVALARAGRYLEAGADCIFVPGVDDAETIGRLAAEIPAPLNIVAGLTATLLDAPTLFSLGVRRISLGGGLARAALSLVERAGHELLESGTLGFLDGAISYGELQRRFAE